eukprot:jgi/Botrbrau1/21817/Bobra.0190s0034.1
MQRSFARVLTTCMHKQKYLGSDLRAALTCALHFWRIQGRSYGCSRSLEDAQQTSSGWIQVFTCRVLIKQHMQREDPGIHVLSID